MFTLDEVVPWGRSFDEYRRMFALTDADLGRTLLGCADGPASFNAEASRRGVRVVSCDPLYQFGKARIEARIAETSPMVLEQTRRSAREFVWGGSIRSVEELAEVRRAAMQAFLDDFDAGRAEGRYVVAGLPTLPFAEAAFDLAVCSHFLFLYSSHLGETMHVVAMRELCRVATEVRVFPLVTLDAEPSPFVDVCAGDLRAAGFDVDIERVDYEFQRGGNRMMRVRRSRPRERHAVGSTCV